MEALPRQSSVAGPPVRRLVSGFVAAAAIAVAAIAVCLVVARPAHAATICEQFGSTVAGNYIIMNNRWGSDGPQCIETSANGFTIIQQDGLGNPSGAPASYPAIYLGCHYTNCSPNSPLPAQISTMGDANTSISLTYPSSGSWNAAYDIWINADTDVSGVQDTEIMIWLNRQGSIQPIGSPVATVTLAGRSWQVWVGSNGQNNVVSYLATALPITSISFNARDFILDAITRGSNFGTTSWYLTSIQAGFEPWVGGVGLAVNSFSATIGGSVGNPPGTPGTPTATNVTASSVSLSWSASSGTVNSYEIERATGASSTNFTLVGTSSSTSFTDSGLSANTTYRYRVRATNSAGSSGYSAITNVTTTGGSSGGSCSFRVDSWGDGFVAYVQVFGPQSGWSIPFTVDPNTTIVNSWNAVISPSSGANRTATNMSYNGDVAAGQSTEWGFQGTLPAGAGLPTFPSCSA